MSRSWIKEVAPADSDPEKYYFIARKWETGHTPPQTCYAFYSRYLSGKEDWSSKPGIAIRVRGGDGLAQVASTNRNKGLVYLEVPADADRRWRARKHPRPRNRL